MSGKTLRQTIDENLRKRLRHTERKQSRAALLRRLGRTAEAEEIENSLRRRKLSVAQAVPNLVPTAKREVPLHVPIDTDEERLRASPSLSYPTPVFEK